MHRVEVNASWATSWSSSTRTGRRRCGGNGRSGDAERTCELTTVFSTRAPTIPPTRGTVLREVTLAGLNAVECWLRRSARPRGRRLVSCRCSRTSTRSGPARGVHEGTGRAPGGSGCWADRGVLQHDRAAIGRPARRRCPPRCPPHRGTGPPPVLDGGRPTCRPGRSHRATAVPVGPRPVPLPPGPVEKVAETGLLSRPLAGSAALRGDRRTPWSTPHSSAGLPKAARVREAYAARLGCDATVRGALVLTRRRCAGSTAWTRSCLDAGILADTPRRGRGTAADRVTPAEHLTASGRTTWPIRTA
ncbi:hypothetical protein HBB16_04520 [Pseudonocardia sp. MCCB 268]|nr:hypothetical protein [Pseudonocardia cytotoxica]